MIDTYSIGRLCDKTIYTTVYVFRSMEKTDFNWQTESKDAETGMNKKMKKIPFDTAYRQK